MKDIKRLKLHSNNYEDSYDINLLYLGLNESSFKVKYDFTDIIKIYNKYKNIQSSGVWEWINGNQKELFDAFENNNIENLQFFFSNFFRNNMLSNGLISHNLLDRNCITNDKERIKNVFNLILQDIDTCRDLTKIEDISLLNFPRIGNPYGILINENLIPPDQPRHYYDAKKIYDLTLDIDNPTIFEIGGGYGGLLINLFKVFKDKSFTYVNCDIFSTSMVFYYVIDNYLRIQNKSNKILINSTNNIVNLKNSEQNIILNVFNNKFINFSNDIDIVYNSHSLSEMKKEHIDLYMNIIMKNNTKYFYHINADYFPWKISYKNHIEINASTFSLSNYKKIIHSISPWISGGNERYREFLYQKM